jgi:hypothetical protein
MSSDSETQTSQLSQSEPITLNNSPIAYGLGSFGLESAYKVFIGFYIFFYMDTLGLAIALVLILGPANLSRSTKKQTIMKKPI